MTSDGTNNKVNCKLFGNAKLAVMKILLIMCVCEKPEYQRNTTFTGRQRFFTSIITNRQQDHAFDHVSLPVGMTFLFDSYF